MVMTVKEQLRQLVDLIDEDVESLEEAIDYLRWLASDQPEDLTEEECKRVRKGEAQLARGEGVAWKDVKRELAAARFTAASDPAPSGVSEAQAASARPAGPRS